MTSRPARLLAVLALVAPAAGLLVTLTAGPALAATGNITAPAANTVVTDGTSSVTAAASVTLNSGEYATLSVSGPGVSTNTSSPVYKCSNPLGCNPQSTKISVSVNVSPNNANGTYSVVLASGGKTLDSQQFFTNFTPNADPGSLAAAANGRTEVDLSWAYSGSEPDKAGFEVNETHAGATRTIKVGTSACNGSTCGTSITYPQPDPGATEDYSYTVTALRSACSYSACGDYTRSSKSASANASLVGPPPAASPTPSASPGSGTTGGQPSQGGSGTPTASASPSPGASGPGTTGSGSKGSAGSSGSGSGSALRPITVPTLPPLVTSRRAFALGFDSFSPSLDIPKLPPLPKTTFPESALGGDSTYQPTLPYRQGGSTKTTSVLSSPIAQITSSLDTDQLMKLIAMALVLFATAAHVRLMLSRSSED